MKQKTEENMYEKVAINDSLFDDFVEGYRLSRKRS
jgi:hypothetical protein